MRNTRETRIASPVAFDGAGTTRLVTGIPFFEHMPERWRGPCRMRNEMLSLAGCSGLEHGVYRTKMLE